MIYFMSVSFVNWYDLAEVFSIDLDRKHDKTLGKTLAVG